VTLFLKVRRAGMTVVVLVAMTALIAAAGRVLVPVPTLFSAGLAVPLSVLLPLAVPLVVLWSQALGEPRLEGTSTRRVPGLDLGLALCAGLGSLLACLVLGSTVGPTPEAYAAARNSVGYLGLGMAARSAFGAHPAAVVPAAYALLAMLFGGRPSGGTSWWAWPVADAGGLDSWVWAISLAVLGGVAALRFRRLEY
jgi:hypothetical protein